VLLHRAMIFRDLLTQAGFTRLPVLYGLMLACRLSACFSGGRRRLALGSMPRWQPEQRGKRVPGDRAWSFYSLQGSLLSGWGLFLLRCSITGRWFWL